MDKFLEFKVNPNRIPIEAFWDQSDPRLLAVETEYANLDEPTDEGVQNFGDVKVTDIENDFKKKAEEFTGKTIETFFVTTDYGVKRQDTIKFEESDETLLGV